MKIPSLKPIDTKKNETGVTNSNEYDLIININSIRFLYNPGWKIEFFERTNYDKNKIR